MKEGLFPKSVQVRRSCRSQQVPTQQETRLPPPGHLWWGSREARSEGAAAGLRPVAPFPQTGKKTVWAVLRAGAAAGCGAAAGPGVTAGTQRRCWARAGPLLGAEAGAAGAAAFLCVRFKISLTGHFE